MAILTPPVHMTALLSRKLGITHRLRIGLSWLLKNPDSEGEWNLCGASRVYFQCVCEGEFPVQGLCGSLGMWLAFPVK